jgi:hypothetical protein
MQNRFRVYQRFLTVFPTKSPIGLERSLSLRRNELRECFREPVSLRTPEILKLP